jgi:hypothetical protein
MPYYTRERIREMNHGVESNWQARQDQMAHERENREKRKRALEVIRGVGTPEEVQWAEGNTQGDLYYGHHLYEDKAAQELYREKWKELHEKYAKFYNTESVFKLWKNRDAIAALPEDVQKKIQDAERNSNLTLTTPPQELIKGPINYLFRKMVQDEPSLSGKFTYQYPTLKEIFKAQGGQGDFTEYPPMELTLGAEYDVKVFLNDPAFGRIGKKGYSICFANFRLYEPSELRVIGLWLGAEKTSSSYGDPVVGRKIRGNSLSETYVKTIDTLEEAAKKFAKFFASELHVVQEELRLKELEKQQALEQKQERERARAQKEQARSAPREEEAPRAPAPRSVVQAENREKIETLENALRRMNSNPEGQAHVRALIAIYERGGNPTDDELKKLRNLLYRAGMRPQADMFRMASLSIEDYQMSLTAKAPQQVGPGKKDPNRMTVQGPANRNPVVQGLIERGTSGAGKHKNQQDFARGHARAPKHKGKSWGEDMESGMLPVEACGMEYMQSPKARYHEGPEGAKEFKNDMKGDPARAQEWAENTEKYQDKFKAAGLLPSEIHQLRRAQEAHKAKFESGKPVSDKELIEKGYEKFVDSKNNPPPEVLEVREKMVEKKTAASGIYPERCKVGQTYNVGYKQFTDLCIFKGWKIDAGGPNMVWEAVDGGGEWEAYMYHGYMCVGSSADKIVILPA